MNTILLIILAIIWFSELGNFDKAHKNNNVVETIYYGFRALITLILGLALIFLNR